MDGSQDFVGEFSLQSRTEFGCVEWILDKPSYIYTHTCKMILTIIKELEVSVACPGLLFSGVGA